MSAPTRDRDRDRELTREQRPWTVERRRFLAWTVSMLRRQQNGQMCEVGHMLASEIEVLLAAAERSLAAKPASDEEIDSWDACDPENPDLEQALYHAGFRAGYREGERRLLLPADDGDARDETGATR